MTASTLKATALMVASVLIMLVWAFPVLWTLLTSFKAEVDVLAYPPVVIFEPQWRNYVDVLFGPITILPYMWDSVVVSVSATALTIVLAVPAAYGFARLRFTASRRSASIPSRLRCCPRWGS